MQISKFLSKLSQNPESIRFTETMSTIDKNYSFAPVEFHNGAVFNEAGQNSGSCKVFAFGKLHQLDKAQTLACFGENYWVDVLNAPEADNHANIRSFMENGWDGIRFADETRVLQPI